MNPTLAGNAILAQVLNASSLRHKVIAQNVANVNTPGYHRLEVAFESDLAKALANPAPGRPAVSPKVIVADGPERVDGNTVDVDREMNDLTKNALLYQAASQILAARISQQRAAIAGR